jgi:hypothetical protein
MTRTVARDRAGWTEAITLECPCGKRLDLLDEQIPGMVDNAMGKIDWANVTNPAGEQATLWWIKCAWCRRGRRGRDTELLELVRSAKAQGLDRVALP